MHASRARAKRLPPLADLLPTTGLIFCCLSWRLGAAWPRFVVPSGCRAEEYDLRFVRGRRVIVLHPRRHGRQRIDDVVRALTAAGASHITAMPPARLV